MKSDVSGKFYSVLHSMAIDVINDNSNSFLGIHPS